MIGFKSEPAWFMRRGAAGRPRLCLVHVGNLPIAAMYLAAVKSASNTHSKVRGVGEAATYLGMEIGRDPGTGDVPLQQCQYISDSHCMTAAAPCSLHWSPSTCVQPVTSSQHWRTAGPADHCLAR